MNPKKGRTIGIFSTIAGVAIIFLGMAILGDEPSSILPPLFAVIGPLFIIVGVSTFKKFLWR